METLMKTTTLFSAVLLSACVTVGVADAAPAASTAAYYYDEGARRPLTLQPGLIAEVGPGQATVVKSALPTAEVVHASSAATVYKAGAAEVLQTLASSRLPQARLSPVYRDGTGGPGSLRALPGGVLVNFKPEWTAAQVGAFVSQRGLTLGQKLNLAGNWYLVNTPAGEAALRAANAIQESGAVVSSAPNWWQQASAR
jgi:hypothetical protein